MMNLLSTGQPKNLGRFLSRISFSRRVVLGLELSLFLFFLFFFYRKKWKVFDASGI